MIYILDVTAVVPEYDAAEIAAAIVVGAIGPPRKFTCANGLLMICVAAFAREK